MIRRLPFSLGSNMPGNLGATLNQLIFSGSYFVGLQAAATYRQLAQKNVTQSKVNVAEAVTKAYYSAQVAVERAKVLDLNIERLDTLMRDTRATFEAGFVEKIDVDRLEVQLNNLKTERQNVQNLIELSYALLKFQMGMPLTDQIILTDIVDESDANNLPAPISNAVDYGKRIEYSILNTQGELAELDIKRIRTGYLPTASAFASYGYNTGRNDFGEVFTQKWFNNSTIGLNVQIPIFDGLTKKYQLQQSQITLDKLNQSRNLLSQSIDLQVQQANISAHQFPPNAGYPAAQCRSGRRSGAGIQNQVPGRGRFQHRGHQRRIFIERSANQLLRALCMTY